MEVIGAGKMGSKRLTRTVHGFVVLGFGFRV